MLSRRLLCFVLALACPQLARGQTSADFQVPRADQAPVIDGVLDDPVWTVEPMLLEGDWVSYSPLHGDRVPQRTEVRIAYDDRNLYFAFHCIDAEPDRIRTTISRRDTAFSDDWVAISLDSAGSGQAAYHLFVNPSGVQMDALNTTGGGEQFEADFVWDSEGKILDDGYAVEFRLPLQNIRFNGGSIVTMGIRFFRKISRAGISVAWPEMLPGQWVFNRPAHLVFRDLNQPRLLEVLPSVTYSWNQTRETPDRWNPSSDKAAVGLSAKYGITGSITLDATVHPDFSQVESDAYQVQVNQRFPIFFSEKRPFFMEGMGLFSLAGGGNIRRHVDTRRIVNPSWGTKLTGSAGRVTFGLLNAEDRNPDRFFTIGRATYGMGGSNYVGGIVTNTYYNGRYNTAVGGDLTRRFGDRQSITVMATGTTTRTPGGASRGGVGGIAGYYFNSRSLNFNTEVEHYDREFQMDTAFYNRTGFTVMSGYIERNFFPGDGDSWVQRVAAFTFVKGGRDRAQNEDESFSEIGLRMNTVRQGYFQLNISRAREPWAGRQYRGNRRNFYGSGQIFQWLSIGGGMNWGEAVYYDPVAPFQGESQNSSFDITLQPSTRLNQNISYNGVHFTRASNNEAVFDVHIVNSRTIFQFSRKFFTRATLQYDSSQRRLLTDLLASYEFSPGTVVHFGYGSLTEKGLAGSPEYLAVSRGVFFKASYRYWF